MGMKSIRVSRKDREGELRPTITGRRSRGRSTCQKSLSFPGRTDISVEEYSNASSPTPLRRLSLGETPLLKPQPSPRSPWWRPRPSCPFSWGTGSGRGRRGPPSQHKRRACRDEESSRCWATNTWNAPAMLEIKERSANTPRKHRKQERLCFLCRSFFLVGMQVSPNW